MIWRLLLFYVLAVGVVVALQPWTATAASDGTVESSPFVHALDNAGVAAAGHIMNGVLIVAALSAANGCLYASSRMFHSLALDGMAPPSQRRLRPLDRRAEPYCWLPPAWCLPPCWPFSPLLRPSTTLWDAQS